MNIRLFLNLFLIVSLCCVHISCGQVINEGFDEVFGAFAADGDEPVDGWASAKRSTIEGSSGMFPGLDQTKGYFDAQAGAPDSYLAMNYNNAQLASTDTTSHWLMTPVVDFNDGDRFSFWTRTIEASQFPDRLVVRMSLAGDSTDVGDTALTVGDFSIMLEDVNPMNLVGGYPEEWTKFDFELTGFEPGASGRIALQYFNTNMDINGSYIGIDSFQFVPFILGDGNGNGVLDLLDIQPFVDLLATGEFLDIYDFNNDGQVTLLDVEPFVDALAAL